MKTVTTFDKADFDLLEAAQKLAERIYLIAEDESGMERVASRASVALVDLLSEVESCPTIEGECECPPCAGDCAECHCEGCVEDEPEAVTAEQLRAKVAEVLGGEPSGIEVVTTPTGEDLLKALAEIFGA
jgi:hypothetical protein